MHLSEDGFFFCPQYLDAFSFVQISSFVQPGRRLSVGNAQPKQKEDNKKLKSMTKTRLLNDIVDITI